MQYNSTTETKKYVLSDIADIFWGEKIIAKDRQKSVTECRIIRPYNIIGTGLNLGKQGATYCSTEIYNKMGKDHRAIVRIGDILVRATGKNNYAIINKDIGNAIVSHNILVVRLKTSYQHLLSQIVLSSEWSKLLQKGAQLNVDKLSKATFFIEDKIYYSTGPLISDQMVPNAKSKYELRSIQIEKNLPDGSESKGKFAMTCLCPKHNTEMTVVEKNLDMLGNVKIAQCPKCQNLYIGRIFMNAEMIMIEGVRYQYLPELKCQEPLLCSSERLSLNEQQDDTQHKEKSKTQQTAKNIKPNSCAQNSNQKNITKERHPKLTAQLQYQRDIAIINNDKKQIKSIDTCMKNGEHPKKLPIPKQAKTDAICYKVPEPKIQQPNNISKNKEQKEGYNVNKNLGINFATSENTLYICKSISACKQKRHNVELVRGYVANPNGKYPVINANYCRDCNQYFIDYKEYVHYRDLYGVIMGNFRDIGSKRVETNFGDLAEQSILHLNSYNVGENEGLSASVRQKILAHLMDANILSKPEILSLLSFFVDLNAPKERMALAISKWDEDMKFVRNYQLDAQRPVAFNEIRHNGNNKIITNLSTSQTHIKKQETTSSVVIGQCTLIALILDDNKETTFFIDITRKPEQRSFVGLKVGDCFKLHGVPKTYKIKKIILT